MAYAWNAPPIDMTNIIQSFVAKGHTFPFLVDLDLSRAPDLGDWGQVSVDHLGISLFVRDRQTQILNLVNDNRRDYHRGITNTRARLKLFVEGDNVLVECMNQLNTAMLMSQKTQLIATGPYCT